MLTAYVINTPFDNVTPGDNLVSLREAVTAANTNLPFGDAPAGEGGGVVDQITFSESLIDQPIVLGGVELTVSDDLSITGLGAGKLIISGNNASGVLYIESDVTVDISELTIADGNESCGAGIYNEATLTLTNTSLINNSADFGAGIYNEATLSVNGGTLAHNSAVWDGAGIYNEGAPLSPVVYLKTTRSALGAEPSVTTTGTMLLR